MISCLRIDGEGWDDKKRRWLKFRLHSACGRKMPFLQHKTGADGPVTEAPKRASWEHMQSCKKYVSFAKQFKRFSVKHIYAYHWATGFSVLGYKMGEAINIFWLLESNYESEDLQMHSKPWVISGEEFFVFLYMHNSLITSFVFKLKCNFQVYFTLMALRLIFHSRKISLVNFA